MIISETIDWIVLNHTILWIDDEWKECKLENWEYRWCKDLEEANKIAKEFFEKRWIKEDIEISIL